MLLNALLKIKGDTLADVELPLAEGELTGLGVTDIKPLDVETAHRLLPFQIRNSFQTIFQRKLYRGSTKFFFATGTWDKLRGLREKVTYFSDIFVWSSERQSPKLSTKEIACRLGLPPADRARPETKGFATYIDEGQRGALLHIVPLYWFLEYSFHALTAAQSTSQVPKMCDALLTLPFSSHLSPLGHKVFGDNSYTTAHFTHGLHQYKGKFFPRMVRSLLNAHHPNLVVDPFCGSGTLQGEAMTSGYRSVGFDLNPLSIELCKMKSEILEVNPEELNRLRANIVTELESPRQLRLLRESPETYGTLATFRAEFPSDLREKLSPDDVAYIEGVLSLIEVLCQEPCRHIFRMILSDAVKSKVRVRVGGKTQFFYAIEPNTRNIASLFASAALHACKFSSAWQVLQQRLGLALAKSVTLYGDAKAWPKFDVRPDLIITSPPYFPYTGISYVYTNLAAMAVLGIKGLQQLERSMMGNTINRPSRAPSRFDEVADIQELFSFLSGDQFRKSRIPVYRQYFDDLGRALGEMNKLCQPEAQIRFVIAKYQKLYTMKEKRAVHNINCARIASQIGEQVGLIYEGAYDIPLFKSDKVSLYPSNEGVETILTFRTKGMPDG